MNCLTVYNNYNNNNNINEVDVNNVHEVEVNNDSVVKNVCNYNPTARRVNPVVIQNITLSVDLCNPYKQSVVTFSEDFAVLYLNLQCQL